MGDVCDGGESETDQRRRGRDRQRHDRLVTKRQRLTTTRKIGDEEVEIDDDEDRSATKR